MSGEGMHEQGPATSTTPPQEVVEDATISTSSVFSDPQSELKTSTTTQSDAIPPDTTTTEGESSDSAAGPEREKQEADPAADAATEITADTNQGPLGKELASSYQPEEADSDSAEEEAEFVAPDVEHIVSTGAAQDGSSSMQALRELVAKARESAGQPREALPPGFGDDDQQESLQAQRGEKRKAEDELEELVEASSGIEEVKAAAENSQHPETKTLLQKALSSISGLVSRRSKPETPAIPTSTTGAEQDKAEEAEAESSDDSDSSSDSNSSSGDSSDDEDDAQDATLVLVGEDDDDDEGGPSGSTIPATKNEILAPEVEQPPIQELSEENKQSIRKLGKVHSIVDSVVVVEQDVQQSKQPESGNATTGPIPVDSTGRQGEREGEYSVLDTGSLLCFEDGKVLGLVFETFGSIHNPMYSIRFASAAAIDRDLVKTGRPVFYVPGQSTYVLTQLLRSMKGSDASNMWDEEVAEDEIDYSDDEQEAEAKRRAKATRSGKVDEQGNPITGASARSNKRQKQGAGQSSVPPHPQKNGSYLPNQRPGHVGAGNNGLPAGGQQQQPSYQRAGNNNVPQSLPRRPGAGSGLPLPPAPAGTSSLGPAFPHGVASLPPKPAAGLPSKPTFQSEASSPRSRTATAESTTSGSGHMRMHSGTPSSLPAKPVDAAAAADAMASASPKAGVTAAQPRAPGANLARPTPPVRGAYPYQYQGSPGWYGGSGSPPKSTPASPAAASQNGMRGSAHSPGGAAPPTQGDHYNPAYVGYWQQPGPHGQQWNAAQAYQAPPMHMAQAPYGGYAGAHGGYGAAHGGQWNNQVYPGSHYPGYAPAPTPAGSATKSPAAHAQAGHYAPSAHPHAYGSGTYSTQPPAASTDTYNAYGYGPSAAYATAAPPSGQESYDPRSPSVGHSDADQQQHGSGSHGH